MFYAVNTKYFPETCILNFLGETLVVPLIYLKIIISLCLTSLYTFCNNVDTWKLYFYHNYYKFNLYLNSAFAWNVIRQYLYRK